MKDQMFKLFGKQVRIRAYGVDYKGLLVGADEDRVYLKAPTTWITLPLMEVTSIMPEGAHEQERIHKPVQGEQAMLTEEEREAKRRYFTSDRKKKT